jgi:DNA-binding transcriptional LysR family regulator
MNIQPESSTPRMTEALATCFSTSCTGVIAFVSVASEGSFARAADRLGIGRSAVSRSVRRLETQVGARLLRRTTRSISLTTEGEAFYRACRPGVEMISRAMDDVRELREGPPSGHLRISAPQGFGRQVVAPLLSEFRERFPDISLELQLDEGALCLATHRIDVAFLDGPLEDSQLCARPLAPMRMRVCASADYARRHGLPDSVEALAAHSCIGLRLPDGRLQRWNFSVGGHRRSLTPTSHLVFNDAALVLQSALDGQGLAQLPACQAEAAIRDGRLLTCLSDLAAHDRDHYICYLSRRQQPRRIRAFVDFMVDRISATG